MVSNPKLYKWGAKGMLVAKASDPDDIKFTEKADLGLFGGPTSKIVKNLPGYAWGTKEMKAGTKYAKISDVQALMGGKPVPQPVPNPEPVPAPPAPTPLPPPPPPKAITSLRIQSTGDKVQTNVPFTVGQVFAPGDLAAGKALIGLLPEGTMPLQLDVKATHPDGSVRHAIVSGIVPRVEPDGYVIIDLAAAEQKEDGNGRKLMVLAKVELTVDGVTYTADNSESKERRWMSGRIVTELHASQPLRDSKGNAHPHLHARFATRCYDGERTRLDVSVESDWAYEPEPRNFTYDLRITIGDGVAYEKKALTHYHHARWRKLFWYGDEPQLHIRHDTAYLIATKALPNYDQSVKVAESTLADYDKKWTGSAIEPMQVGPLVQKGMPTTGGRNDLGLLPGWAASYLLSMDPRAKKVMLGTADLAGSWSMHYRDKNTDLPVSLIDYPYMTILGNPGDTKNPKTGQREAFPTLVKGQSSTPFKHDTSHQPNMAYLPYLVTGDYYYLEELQFWASYNVFMSNPGWRKNVQGLVADDQVRGQAWSMRTLGEAAYITPDSHPLKKYFQQVLDSNLDYYNTRYSDNPQANALGVLDMSSAVIYKEKKAVAPWQDDFFTSAIGHVADLGFDKAEKLLKWKAKFPIGRMIGEGVSWLVGANYTYDVRLAQKEPIYGTFKEAYTATVGPERAKLPLDSAQLAKALEQQPNDMGGYSSTPIGYPSNMQPALAYAADYCGEDGKKAWARFMSRSIKPNYSLSPQFAIVPRSV